MDTHLHRSGLDRQLGFLLRKASEAVWADLRETLKPFGLRPQTYAILLIVSVSPGCKQQDVADALGIQRANLVALVDQLCALGWIDRHVNQGDRRSYSLKLSAEGRAALAAAGSAHRDHERRLAAMLDDSDDAALRRTLERLANL